MARWRVTCWCATALAIMAGGCRESEQNRPLSLEPGVYKGAPTPVLTKDQVDALNKRGLLLK